MEKLEHFIKIDNERTEALRAAQKAAPELMRQYREQHGLSKYALARLLRVTVPTVTRFESGKQIGVPALHKLYEFLRGTDEGEQ